MKFIYLFLFLFLFSSVSAGLNVGYDQNSLIKNVVLNIPSQIYDNNTALVNSTEWWITDIGPVYTADAVQHNNVGGVLTISETYLESWATALYCKLTGCTMAGDIQMGANDINGSGTVTAEQITSTDDMIMAGLFTNVVQAGDSYSFFNDGDTNPKTSSSNELGFFKNYRTISGTFEEDEEFSTLAMHNKITTNLTLDTSDRDDWEFEGIRNQIASSGTIIGDGGRGSSVRLKPIRNLVTTDWDMGGQDYWDIDIRGMDSNVDADVDNAVGLVKNSGATITVTGTTKEAVGKTVNVEHIGLQLNVRVDGSTNVTNGEVTIKALNFDGVDQTQADNVWGIYMREVEVPMNHKLANDNQKTCFGTSEEMCIWYDSDSNGYINPKEVGSGQLRILGDLNQTLGNFTGNNIYGSSFGNEIGDVTISSSGVYYNITNITAGELNGFSFNVSGNSELTALIGGMYKLDSGFSFSGGANTEYHLRISKNNVGADNCHAQRKIGTGGDVGTGSTTPCLVRLEIGDKINIQIENVDNTNDATIHDVGLTAWRVGN